jgi:hypothetical protein
MRQTTITCDRCSALIIQGAAVLTIEAGDLRDRLHSPVDLCRECAGKLVEWLSTAQMNGEDKRSRIRQRTPVLDDERIK